jgi:PIN domain-containing protein
MRLRNAGGIDNAQQSLRSIQTQLENTGSASINNDRRSGMLQWIEDMARPVFEMVLDDDGVLADLETSYDRLALAPAGTNQYSLVAREQSRWRGRLRRIEEEMQGDKRFAGRPGFPVIVDTSVLMEALPLSAITWPDLVGAANAGQIRVIVPILVVEELDELLHDRDAKRRDKARHARRFLWSLHSGTRPTEPSRLPDNQAITLEVAVDRSWRERSSDNDAEIIEQALQVYRLTGRALLVACDLHQVYRAEAMEMPASLIERN